MSLRFRYFNKIILVQFFVLGSLVLSAQCFNCNNQNPSDIVNPAIVNANIGQWSNVSNDIKADDFARFNVTAGFSYEWEICGEIGFETVQLNLFFGSLCDNSFLIEYKSGSCVQLSYTASNDSEIILLLSNPECNPNLTELSLNWRTTCSPVCNPAINYLGANLHINSNTFMGGRHYNIGTFTLDVGVTIELNCHTLQIEANDIVINGFIDGNKKGSVGGIGGFGGIASSGASGSCSSGNPGSHGENGTGDGQGFHGTSGLLGACSPLNCSECTYGYIAGSGGAGSGSGAAHYANGSTSGGGAQATNVDENFAIGGFGGTGPWFGAFAYGDNTSFSIDAGSGGAGGGGGGGGYTAGTMAGNGGAGGGKVILIADDNLYISNSASIHCNGMQGKPGGDGGFSLPGEYNCFYDINGDLIATDNCGTCPDVGNFYGAGGAGGGSGGGSGGGILLSSADVTTILGDLQVIGGTGGEAGLPNTTNGDCFNNARGGSGGTGGRIKIFRNPCLLNQINPNISALGGLPGFSVGGSVERAASGNMLILDHSSFMGFDSGVITSDQDICIGGIPDPIVFSTPPSGGIGTYLYQWWRCTGTNCSNPPVSYVPIGGANTNTYQPPALGNTTYYSAMVQSGSEECRTWTNFVTITVYPDPIISIIASENQVCQGEPVQLFATVEHGIGSCSFQWEFSDDGITWIVDGGNSDIYNVDVSNPFENRQFRAVYSCDGSGCDVATSNIEIITVAEPPFWENISIVPIELCDGGQVDLDATVENGLGGNIIWYISENGLNDWTEVLSPDNPGIGVWDYQPVYDADGSGCDIDDAPITSITVYANPEAIISIDQNNVCQNEPIILNSIVNGGAGICNYQWQYYDGLSWVNVGTNSSAYSVPTDVQMNGILHRLIYSCDGDSCDSAISNEIEIFVFENPQVLAIADPNPQCVAEDVELNALASGGTPDFIYEWDNFLGNGQIHIVNPLNNTIYTVTVTDSNSCTAESSVEVLLNEAPVVNILADPNPSCAGEEISLTANAMGGLPDYTYEWDNGLGNGQNHLVSPDINTTYTVTVTDSNACTSENSVLINVNELPTVIVVETQQATCGIDNGIAIATPSGGLPPYSYNWSNGDMSSDGIAENLSPGLITVTVSDSNSCTTTGSVMITTPTDIIVTSSETVSISCFGYSDGIGDLSVNGGNPLYEISWTNGITSGMISNADEGNYDLTNLSAGTYEIQILDQDDCLIVEYLNITEPPPVLFDYEILTELDCFGDDIAEISIDVVGGTPLYNFTWSNGIVSGNLNNASEGTHIISDLSEGNYIISITDSNSCVYDFQFVISQPDLIQINSVIISEPDCYSYENAEASIQISGGTPLYELFWNNGTVGGNLDNLDSGQHILSDLGSGLYSITVIDNNLCEQIGSLEISEPDELIVNSNIGQNVSCYGGNDGSILLNISGGTPVFSVNWDNGFENDIVNNLSLGPQIISGLSAGDYNLTITDNNSCEYSLTITINEPDSIEFSANNHISPLCFDSDEGSVLISVLGGTASYSFNWTNGISSGSLAGVGQGPHSISGLTAGSYSITIIDSGNCEQIDNFIISAPQAINPNISAIDASTYGNTDGSASVSPTGGIAPYTYQWEDSSNPGIIISITNTANNLSEGDYCVTITDANLCSVSACIHVSQPPDQLTGLLISHNNISCNSYNDGSVEIIAYGGTPPYSYSWENEFGIIIGNDSQITGLSQGSYYITITDFLMFVWDSVIVITEPNELVLISIFGNDLDCYGYNNASTVVSVDGGTLPYSYYWEDEFGNIVGSANHIFDLVAGTYFVSVTDNNLCGPITSSITINQPELFEVIISLISEPSCFGFEDGAITTTINGGVMPVFSYEWGSPIELFTGANPSGLSAGLYSVTVTDANSCTAQDSFIINQPEALNTEVIINHVTGFGESDGSINLTVLGGSAPYQYQWENSANPGSLISNAPAIDNLAVGLYCVTINDNNSCTLSECFEIFEPEELIIVLEPSNVSCFGDNTGTILASVSGGIPEYEYYWEDENGNFIGNTSMIDNLYAGFYYLTVTDSNNYSATSSILLSQPTQINLSLVNIQHVSCFGFEDAQIEISVNGGTGIYSSSWFDESNPSVILSPGFILSGVGAGNFVFSLTDENDCLSDTVIQITQPNEIIISFTDLTEPTCFGFNNGSLSIEAHGGTGTYEFLWNEISVPISNNFFENLESGWHYVTVIDQELCINNDSVFLSQPTELLLSLIDTLFLLCHGNANGMTSISIAGGTPSYDVFWFDEDSNQIGTALWINSLAAGTYTVSVTDSQLCIATDTLMVIEPPALIVDIFSENPSCYMFQDGKLWVSVNGGTPSYNYNWSTPGAINNDTVFNVPQGLWSVTVTDINNCSFIASAEIFHPEQIVVTDITNPVDCSSHLGSSVISVSGGTTPYSFLWSTGFTGSNPFNLPGGLHNVTVTDENGCFVIHSVEVLVEGSIDVNLVQTEFVLCYADMTASLRADVIGHFPFNYSWQNYPVNNSNLLQNIGAGNYSVTVTDSWNCQGTAQFVVSQPEEIQLQFEKQDVLCYGGTSGWARIIAVGGTGVYNYFWTHNGSSNNTTTGLGAGTYSVILTDANNCEVSGNILITQPLAPLTGIISAENALCFGSNNGKLSVLANGGTPPYSYNWTGPGLYTNSTFETARNLAPGTYYLSITDANSCANYMQHQITEPQPVNFEIEYFEGPSCSGNFDGIVQISNITGGTSPYWVRISGEGFFREQEDLLLEGLYGGNYRIDVIDANNCIQNRQSSIVVLIDAEIDCLQIPAAFSPNGDGFNDTWQIDNLHMFPRILIQVYNRWGQLVYDGNANSPFWDGTHNDKPVPTGAYIYHIDLYNDRRPVTGVVTIVR